MCWQVSFRTGFECSVPQSSEQLEDHCINFEDFAAIRAPVVSPTDEQDGKESTRCRGCGPEKEDDDEGEAMANSCADRATADKLAYTPCASDRFPNSLRLCFAHYDEPTLVEGVRRISLAIARWRKMTRDR